MGPLKQEIQERLFCLWYGTTITHTNGKTAPPEATVQLGKRWSPDTGLEQWVKTEFQQGRNKS